MLLSYSMFIGKGTYDEDAFYYNKLTPRNSNDEKIFRIM